MEALQKYKGKELEYEVLDEGINIYGAEPNFCGVFCSPIKISSY